MFFSPEDYVKLKFVINCNVNVITRIQANFEVCFPYIYIVQLFSGENTFVFIK